MGLRDHARPWFFLNLRAFLETLIYQRHGSNGVGMAEVFFFLTFREFIVALIYPRHGSERLGIVKVLFNTYIIVGALIHQGVGARD